MPEPDKLPSWYDRSKIVRAMYAPGYGGWVVDLEDGTCRFANDPLLADPNLKWGARVDLFYPSPEEGDQDSMPFV